MFYFVSTPIGNLKDISYRAIEVLNSVDIIICEDTRRTNILLKNYSILKKKLIIYNDFNKKNNLERIIELAKENNIAFVSDNGTPCINDPGYLIIQKLIENNIKYTIIPGASAFINALVLSGLPTDSFSYYGFLPKTKCKIEKILFEIENKPETIIFYESPHRILKTIKILENFNFDFVIVREITKKFEEVIRFENNKSKIRKLDNIKGEIVLLLKSKKTKLEIDEKIYLEIKDVFNTFKKYYSDREVFNKISQLYDINKNKIYEIVKK